MLRDLPPDLKAEYALWRQRCDAAAASYADKPGSLHAALLDGLEPLPRMPLSLRPVMGAAPMLTEDMTIDQIADLYHQRLREGRTR
jgi:hypothetical protein